MKRHINLHYQVMVKCSNSVGLIWSRYHTITDSIGQKCGWGCQVEILHFHAVSSNRILIYKSPKTTASGTRKWPTDTCRPFLYKIFPTFSPHLTIILQKVFRFFCNFSTAHITPELRRIICLASSIRRV